MIQPVFIASPTPRNLETILNRLSSKPFVWAYLGQSIADFRRAQRRFQAQGNYLNTTPEFHRASGNLRGPYLNYVYRIGSELNSLRWWLTSTSYRNGYSSKAFHQSCYLKVGLDLTKSQKGPEPLVLLSDDPVCRALELNLFLGKRMLVYSLVPRQRFPMRHVVDTVKILAHRAKFFSRETYRLFQSRWIGSPTKMPSQPASMLFSWVTNDNLKLGPNFHRSFFGDLAAQLGELGCSVGIVPVVTSEVTYHEALRKIGDGTLPLFIPHRYIGLFDLFRAAVAACFKPSLPSPIPKLEGMDITLLLQEELRQDQISNQAADALLMVALVQRWAQSGTSIKNIIFNYENQPWQRALCWEARRLLPATRITGYQHARVPQLLLNFYLAQGEERIAPLPDRVVTVGQYSAQLLLNGGFSAERIRVGGALQMDNFFQSTSQPDRPDGEGIKPTVLFASSSGLEETVELADLAFRLFDEGAGIQIALKCHPLTPFEMVSHLVDNQVPGNVEVSQEPIIDLMMKSSVMVYSGSTVCVQALALGLPVIHLRPQFDLDLDPLEASQHLRLEATGLDELRQQIIWLLENRDSYIEKHRKDWNDLVREMYGPVTSDSFRAFID